MTHRRHLSLAVTLLVGLALPPLISRGEDAKPYPAEPGEVVKAMVTAASEQKFDEARKFMDADWIASAEFIFKAKGGVRGWWANLLKDFTMEKIEYAAPRIDGDKAKVRISIHFKDNTNGGTDFKLQKRDGKWIAMGN